MSIDYKVVGIIVPDKKMKTFKFIASVLSYFGAMILIITIGNNPQIVTLPTWQQFLIGFSVGVFVFRCFNKDSSMFD